jgi:hypothetical protein
MMMSGGSARSHLLESLAIMTQLGDVLLAAGALSAVASHRGR